MSSDPSLTTASPQDDFARAHLPPRALWPQLCLDLPELQYPPRLNCVAVLLDAAVASGGGERTAILADGQRWTYAQLARQVDRIAHVLPRIDQQRQFGAAGNSGSCSPSSAT